LWFTEYANFFITIKKGILLGIPAQLFGASVQETAPELGRKRKPSKISGWDQAEDEERSSVSRPPPL